MIRTAQLRYAYAGGVALDFPDIDVAQGGVLLLRGRSGSGKSTWLALAAGLLRPNSGQITVAGQDLTAMQKIATDAWRAGAIGFLPQKLHLSEALTVAGNLAMAQWAAGLPDDAHAVYSTLDALGVADLARRKPRQLSGGQAQRVALARAVLLQPKVILADEPTASLDDEAAQAALSLLQTSAQRSHATLVIATHDARVSAALPQAAICQIGPQRLSDLYEQL
ncbi:ABC transporter ATP-binding protein [Rhodoferax sp.]|uniref:ABC transporter ATP-binding protein n=1 Tax=Rhodoferax sp. TaxID=50421 RepID=UPI00374CDBE5